MEMIGFAVLLGIATGYLWGDYLATKKASKRLEFWRDQAARFQGEGEGMIRALAQADADREAMRSELTLLRRDVERRAIKREQAAARKSRENVMKAGEVGREP